jgi:hypothetical protein
MTLPKTGVRPERHGSLMMEPGMYHIPAGAIGRGVPPVEPPRMGECCHHWIIAPLDGATSPAFCKRCGAEREFRNYAEGKGLAYRKCSECKETLPATKDFFPPSGGGGLRNKCRMCTPIKTTPTDWGKSDV